MRKIILFTLLFFSVNAFSQELDTFNRLYYKEVLKIFKNIKSDEERELLIKELDKIVEKTTDEELKTTVLSKKEELSNLKLKKYHFSFQDVSSLNKKEYKNYEFSFDKFKNRTFVYSKSAYRGDFILDPYISYKEGKASMILKTRYYSSSWLFHDEIYFLIDGNVHELSIEKPETKVLSGSRISEISTTVLSDDEVELLRSIVKSNNDVEVRFQGSKYSDKKLSKKEIQHITDVLSFFDKFKIDN